MFSTAQALTTGRLAVNAVRVPRMAAAFLHANSVVRSEATFQADAAELTDKQKDAALAAFGARLGLQNLDSHVLEKAVTHASASQENNAVFTALGKRVSSLYTLEYLHCRYPWIPTKTLDNVVGAYVGNKFFSRLGKHMGLQHVMRWQPTQGVEGIEDKPLVHEVALSDCMNALIGVIYEKQGEDAAKKFIHAHILSADTIVKDIVRETWKNNPKRHLSALLRKVHKESPISRLVSETGRHSSAPVYVVGVFSGEEKLGEGFGSSLQMAEHRACIDALQTHYCREEKTFTLPSDADKVDHYKPPVLGDSQAQI
ncbi:ribonuclease III domain-containing protein [Radiomyces spectabilis]|uniref:ribonuclease III domain-containing protein n=1 Tax=Radiomyces spectabilis TaxID=64574 RepID=UPI00221F9C61|nr:ribonuclease III domain-containing protein [Radiomyces spectabilis]KAI8376566.1 ribonuclease III domain-containing protein [Radiomyces spectabilis]